MQLKNKIIILSSLPLFILFLVFYQIQFWTVGSNVYNAESELIQTLRTTIESSLSKDHKISHEHVLSLQHLLEKNKVDYAHFDILEETGQRLYEMVYEDHKLKTVSDLTNEVYVPKKINQPFNNIHRIPINIHGNTNILEIFYSKPMLFFGFNTLLIYGVILALVVSALIGFILSRLVVKPLQKMENSIKSIQQKGFTERMVALHSQDEIGRLTSIFNQMMEQLEHSFNKQKQFIEDASHELRTPITALEGHLSLLNRWGKKDELVLEESLQAATEEVKRLRRLVQELIELSREEESSPTDHLLEIINPVSHIQAIIKNLTPIHPEFSFEVLCEDQNKPLLLKCVPSHFDQVILILLDNAIKYSAEIKSISVSVEAIEGEVWIKIGDKGIGIPQENIPYVFDRFYRADPSRSRQRGGYGLGLSIAKRLVENFKGKIDVSSVEGEGTTFTICFPLINGEGYVEA